MTAGRLTIVCLAAFALLATPAAAAAGPGELDPSFGVGGVATVALGGEESGAEGIAVQPDGKIVVAGERDSAAGFAVARLLPDGSLDTSFGGGEGVATASFSGPAEAIDVAVQPDGKIVAAGTVEIASKGEFAVARFLPSGALDPTFGTDGEVVLPIETYSAQARVLAIGPEGRIAVAGTARVPPSTNAAAVALLEAGGTPDTGFGTGGATVIETSSGNDDRAEGIAVQPDGKLVIADSTGAGIGDGFTVVRLDLDGLPDPSFGGDGVVETPIPGKGEIADGRASDVLLQPDGKIVVGGYGANYESYEGLSPAYYGTFALARYQSNGELDAGFGEGGIVSVRLAGGDAFGRSVGLEPDGKLVLGGEYEPGPPFEGGSLAALIRVDADGKLDPSFGDGGIVQRPRDGFREELINRLAIQPDGRILTAGYREPQGGPVAAVVERYLASPEVPSSPSSPSRVDHPPQARIKRVPHKVGAGFGGFSGTASDPDGEAIAKVQVSLVRLAPRTGHRAKAKTKAKPVVPEHWRAARGTARWKLKLRHPLAPGRYVVFARAIDAAGLAESTFSRAAGNRYAFSVPARRHG